MTVGQFESVSAEVLDSGTVEAQTLATSAEALAGGNPGSQTLATAAEVLISVPVTTEFDALAVVAEVLIASALLPTSNVYDWTGVQRDVFQWTGTVLNPVMLSP